jgi:putative GTP pyrophosphokinase
MRYDKVKEIYDDYCEYLEAYKGCTSTAETLVKRLLLDMQPHIVQVDSRTKDPDSLRQKLLRKKTYASLHDITDLCGIRIITYLPEDVDEVCRIIEEEFNVDTDNSVDKANVLDPDQFGYKSVHYIIELSESRRDLPEYSSMAGKLVEIQVRTALQHAWAAIEHKIAYKSAIEAPRELRRALSRLSALLELADEEFTRLNVASQELAYTYHEDLKRGNLEVEVNLDTIRAYLRVTPVLNEWKNIGQAAGFESAGDLLDVNAEGRGAHILVNVCLTAGLETVAALHDALSELEPTAALFLTKLRVRLDQDEFFLPADPTMCMVLALVSSRPDAFPKEQFYELGFIEQIDVAMFEVAKLPGSDPYSEDEENEEDEEVEDEEDDDEWFHEED